MRCIYLGAGLLTLAATGCVASPTAPNGATDLAGEGGACQLGRLAARYPSWTAHLAAMQQASAASDHLALGPAIAYQAPNEAAPRIEGFPRLPADVWSELETAFAVHRSPTSSLTTWTYRGATPGSVPEGRLDGRLAVEPASGSGGVFDWVRRSITDVRGEVRCGAGGCFPQLWVQNLGGEDAEQVLVFERRRPLTGPTWIELSRVVFPAGKLVPERKRFSLLLPVPDPKALPRLFSEAYAGFLDVAPADIADIADLPSLAQAARRADADAFATDAKNRAITALVVVGVGAASAAWAALTSAGASGLGALGTWLGSAGSAGTTLRAATLSTLIALAGGTVAVAQDLPPSFRHLGLADCAQTPATRDEAATLLAALETAAATLRDPKAVDTERLTLAAGLLAIVALDAMKPSTPPSEAQVDAAATGIVAALTDAAAGGTAALDDLLSQAVGEAVMAAISQEEGKAAIAAADGAIGLFKTCTDSIHPEMRDSWLIMPRNEGFEALINLDQQAVVIADFVVQGARILSDARVARAGLDYDKVGRSTSWLQQSEASTELCTPCLHLLAASSEHSDDFALRLALKYALQRAERAIKSNLKQHDAATTARSLRAHKARFLRWLELFELCWRKHSAKTGR